MKKSLYLKIILVQLGFIILLSACKNDKLTEIDIAALQSNRSIWKTDKTHIVDLLKYSKDFEGNLFDPSFMVYVYLDIPVDYNFEIIDIQRFEANAPESYPNHIEINQIIKDIQKLYSTQDIPVVFEKDSYSTWAYQYHGPDDTQKHRYSFFFGISNWGPSKWYECYYFDISFDNQLTSEDLLSIIHSFWSEGIYSRYIKCIINLDTNSLYSTGSYRVKSDWTETLPKRYIRLELPYRLNLLKNEAEFKLSATPDSLFDIDLDAQSLAGIDPISYFKENLRYPYIINELTIESTDSKAFYGIIKLESELYLHVYFKIKAEDYIKPNLNSLEYFNEQV